MEGLIKKINLSQIKSVIDMLYGIPTITFFAKPELSRVETASILYVCVCAWNCIATY